MSPDPPPDPPAAPSLPDTVLRLQRFWLQRGCVLLPGGAFEVPYATLQPDAFFRIVGSRPWRAVCLQPLRRPLDARFGEHPYRLIHHLQMQVVLKPPPADVAALYRESLAAAGLELELHDLRFVERPWERISLGARGASWHALLDGLGVSRLSILERLAGHDLQPASCEISYGLERLSMALSGAGDAFSLGGPEDGPEDAALRRRDELDLSRYVVDVADGAGLRQRLAALEQDAERCLEAGLARPAYELAVKCLEPLDVLDARGALSARERAGWLERIGRRVAAAADLSLEPAGGKSQGAALGGGKRGARRKKTAAKPAGAQKARRRKRAQGGPRKPPPATPRRRRALEAALERQAGELGASLAGDGELLEALVDILAGACEIPGVVRGAFDPDYLAVPEEVILAALGRRQQAFGLRGKDGLLPYFLAVMDRADDPEGFVQAGLERAVAGHLADASFRYDADRRLTLAERRRRLEEIEFHPRLGSWAAKGDRVGALVELACQELGWEDATESATEAAALLKADLTSGMVRDFPSLRGTIGGIYAREEGYVEAVWRAIYEHYRSRPIPAQRAGRLVAVADRLDSLVGYFGIGQAPTGRRDRHSLRRLAEGLLRILIEGEMDLDLDLMAARAVLLYGELLDRGAEELLRELQVFLAERRRQLLEQEGFAADEIGAVAAVGWRSLPDLMARLRALQRVREEGGFRSLVLAAKRIFNIVKDSADFELQPSELAAGAELELHEALAGVRRRVDEAVAQRRYEDGLRSMAELVPPLDRFFADVLVMDENESLKENRVALLQACRRVFWRVARLQEMVVEKSASSAAPAEN